MKYYYTTSIIILIFLFTSCKTKRIEKVENETPENYTRRIYGFINPGTDDIAELNFENEQYQIELFANGLLTKRYMNDHRGVRIKIDTFIYSQSGDMVSFHTVTKDNKDNIVYRDSITNTYKNNDLQTSVFTSHDIIYRGEYTYKLDTIFEDGYIDGKYTGRTFKIFDKDENVITKIENGRTCSSVIKTYLNESGETIKITWQDEGSSEINTYTNFKFDKYGRLLWEKGYKDHSPRSITVYKYDLDPLKITTFSMKSIMSNTK